MPVADRCLYEYGLSKKKDISQKNGYFKTLKAPKTTQTRITYDCTLKYLDKHRHVHRKRRCLFTCPSEKQRTL